MSRKKAIPLQRAKLRVHWIDTQASIALHQAEIARQITTLRATIARIGVPP